MKPDTKSKTGMRERNRPFKIYMEATTVHDKASVTIVVGKNAMGTQGLIHRELELVKKLKESFGFDVGKINPYNADSIQGAIKARKIRNELEESGMYEYLKHVDSPWLSLYEKPNPRQWEKIKNIMKLTGRDLETVIKFIVRTPVGVTADLSLLEEIAEKNPGIIHWKRGFDHRLQKEYCMTKSGMTPEEIEKLVNNP